MSMPRRGQWQLVDTEAGFTVVIRPALGFIALASLAGALVLASFAILALAVSAAMLMSLLNGRVPEGWSPPALLAAALIVPLGLIYFARIAVDDAIWLLFGTTVMNVDDETVQLNHTRTRLARAQLFKRNDLCRLSVTHAWWMERRFQEGIIGLRPAEDGPLSVSWIPPEIADRIVDECDVRNVMGVRTIRFGGTLASREAVKLAEAIQVRLCSEGCAGSPNKGFDPTSAARDVV